MKRDIRANKVHLRVTEHGAAVLTLRLKSGELVSPLVDVGCELSLAYAIIDV